MTIPLPVIMAAVSVMQREAEARSRRQDVAAQSAARLAEVQMERERIQAELDAADRQADREKEILLAALTNAREIHQMKVDAIVAMFRDAKSLLEGHQRILAEEKAYLNRRLVEQEVTAQMHVMIFKQQREVDQQLSKVDDHMIELTEKCIEAIADLHPDMGMARIEQTVTSGLMMIAKS
jgi:hypothetical protein